MLKLCIACSSKVAASSRTCSCGHVFSPETRRIGGKRFSGYRLGTTRRQSFSTRRERQPNGGVVSDPLSRKVRKPSLYQNLKSPKAVQEKSKNPPEKPTTKRKGHPAIFKENQTKAKVKKIDHIVRVLSSPERRLKLSLALAEINRRLTSQMLIWKMLPCETG
ncbi:UPF0547 protein C16orf87 homolog isoform X2 [Pocillopora verrucosa]|uniref:Uncharacterized protein n=1 Tax=Pocillopora meandrina TaxID=46732 RepID=A0AAU9X6B9_9CNID|nr:uncharacterized protein LOC131791038 isoform X2 [Pocillopora verrucosa]CAH3137725.1 unnamed protein product [Pocillopora meandrina]